MEVSKNFAKIPAAQWRPVPGVRPIKPASGDRLRAGDQRVRTRRPRPVCRWSLIERTIQLACRWELEGSHQPSCPLRRDRQLHKIFFELSYQPKLSQMADGSADRPCAARRSAERVSARFFACVARRSLADAIYRRHSNPPCCCEQFAITLGSDLSSEGVS